MKMQFQLNPTLKRVVGIAALSVASLLTTTGTASAEGDAPFRCKPGETYYMNVMVSGVEYWFPVYEMMKQAAQSMGCKTVYTGTPEYDVNKQLASFEQVLAKKPAGILLHPMNQTHLLSQSTAQQRWVSQL